MSRSGSEESAGGDWERREKAAKAFKDKDAEKSRQIHATTNVERHKKGGEFVKSIVYGGLDGLINIFAVVAGSIGGDLDYTVVLILGFSVLLSDGISMGVGDYISTKAELEHTKAEQEREEWEMKNNMDGEKQEMVELYTKKGLSEKEATALVDLLAKNDENFLQTMMVEELGMMPYDPEESPIKDGLITLGSYIVFGIIPLIPFVISSAIAAARGDAGASVEPFIASCVITGCTMFLLGAVTSRFSILPWWRSGLYIFTVGAIASVSSYFISWGVSAITEAIHPSPPEVCINGTIVGGRSFSHAG
eukprot:TRINITY_DN3112_c0_g1_i1.p1 TRINITY_DN3112_c0_g1~~TRINITY_DN3112_c0_g1_i1.p1  ORF type:complete len:306 (+),score=90.52 TRINITY_DN3112_c0_g1_i1:72-989(+)